MNSLPDPAASPSGVRKILVVGAGIMGSGVAAVAAQRGLDVHLYDVRQEFLDRGLSSIRAALEGAVAKGRIPPKGKDAALERIRPTLELSSAPPVDLVLEAAPEKLELKREIFRRLDPLHPAPAILATNTSSLSVTSIASVVADPGRVVGIHFFNPVPSMPLVEIIGGFHTSPETRARSEAFARELGKTVTRSRDSPGFVTTRSMAVLVNEAAWMLYEGVASREDIDTAHKLGFHHPMGPLELADLVGLDTCLAVLERLYTGFQDPKYRVCPLLVNMVEAGRLGRKSGEGFYPYPRSPSSGNGGGSHG